MQVESCKGKRYIYRRDASGHSEGRFRLSWASSLVAALSSFSIESVQAQPVSAAGTNVTVSGVVDTGTATSLAGTGLFASAGGTITGTGPVQVITRGVGAIGASAQNGTITLIGGSSITTFGASAMGLYGLGQQARITATDTSIDVRAADYAVYAVQGARISLTGGEVSSVGTALFSLGVPNDGTQISATDVVIRSARIGAEADRNSLLTLSGGSVTTTGTQGYGLYSLTSSAAIRATGTQILTQGASAFGAYALQGKIDLQDVTIDTTGSSARGVYATDLAVVTVQGGAIRTQGTNSYGVQAVAGAQVALDGTLVATQGAGAIGLVAFSTAPGSNTSVTAENVVVTTTGANAFGAALVGGANMSLAGSRISTQSAAAVYAIANDGQPGEFSISDSVLSAAQGTGISVLGTALTVNLSNSSLSGQTSLWNIDEASATNGELTLIADGSTLTGMTQQSSGSRSTLALSNNSVWNVSGDSRVNTLTNTQSAVQFSPVAGPITAAASYKTLTVNNYSGAGGLIGFNTYLAGDDSQTDRLVIDGGQASGTTRVKVTNSGGPGALTVTGIQLVNAINGATTTPDAFALSGRVVAGPYEYRLLRGASDGSNDQAWYLRSEKFETPTEDPPVGPPQDPPVAPSEEPTVDPSDKPSSGPLYRPEVGAYLANQFFAQRFLAHSLDERRGDMSDPPGDIVDAHRVKSAWLRLKGGYSRSQTSDGNNRAKTDTVILHGGADLFEWPSGNGLGKTYAGLMASYGSARSRARADGNPYRVAARADGWSLGAYGTWYADDQSRLGAYADTWVQFATFRNRVEGEWLDRERYNAHGWSVSAETGYAISTGGRWVIEPQAQIIYQGYRQPGFVENTGVRISDANADGIVTRLGARLYSQQTDSGVRPFAAFNWWRSSSSPSVRLDGQRIDGMYPKSRYELKTGLQVGSRQGLSGWAGVSGNWGEQDYREYALQAGVQYRF